MFVKNVFKVVRVQLFDDFQIDIVLPFLEGFTLLKSKIWLLLRVIECLLVSGLSNCMSTANRGMMFDVNVFIIIPYVLNRIHFCMLPSVVKSWHSMGFLFKVIIFLIYPLLDASLAMGGFDLLLTVSLFCSKVKVVRRILHPRRPLVDQVPRAVGAYLFLAAHGMVTLLQHGNRSVLAT